MASSVKARSLFDLSIVSQAVVDSFRKLTPRRQVRNPVMFVAYVGSILTTLLWVQALVGRGEAPDRKSTRLNSSHSQISYAVFCLKKKNKQKTLVVLISRSHFLTLCRA